MKDCLLTKFCRVLSVLLLAALAGCVKSKITLYVNPDGSGHLVVSRLFARQTVDAVMLQRQQMQQMEGMEEMMGGEGGEAGAKVMEQMKAMMAADPFYDEKALQKEAKNYGAGVKLAKARRVDMDGDRGAIAVYSFKDINDVFLNTDVSRMYGSLLGGGFMPDEGGEDEEDGGGHGRRGKRGVEFSFQTGTVSRLKILLPAVEGQDDDDAPPAEEPSEDDGADEGDEAAMYGCFEPYMMMEMPEGIDFRYMEEYAGNMMSQGMAVSVEVVLRGSIASSTASHTNALNRNRVVLVDMDSSRRDAKAKQRATRNDFMDFHDFNRLMHAISKTPGSVVETNREVVVVFK
jgi:hypothetical protein